MIFNNYYVLISICNCIWQYKKVFFHFVFLTYFISLFEHLFQLYYNYHQGDICIIDLHCFKEV